MSAEQNQEVFRRVIEEGFGQGRLEVLEEAFAPGFVEHEEGVEPPTVEGIKQAVLGFRAAFPDLQVQVDDRVAVGDQVWARTSGHGTHLGEFMGIPPTGKRVRISGMNVCRFVDGRIVEHWGIDDLYSLLKQLDALG